MTVKHLLVLSAAAACFPTFAQNNQQTTKADAAPEKTQKVNIVKVIDFTKTPRTEEVQKANIAEIIAATEHEPMPAPTIIPSPKLDALDKDAIPVTQYKGKRGYSYTVRGKRYQTYAQSNGFVQQGMASWYGYPFHGRKTASGEIYDMNEMTAAHKELPLGTRVEVTNLSNGRKVIVRVNDRGPFHGNRVLDLSRAAAKELGTLDSGVAKVRIRALH